MVESGNQFPRAVASNRTGKNHDQLQCARRVEPPSSNPGIHNRKAGETFWCESLWLALIEFLRLPQSS